jgi:hypothetical protein
MTALTAFCRTAGTRAAGSYGGQLPYTRLKEKAMEERPLWDVTMRTEISQRIWRPRFYP